MINNTALPLMLKQLRLNTIHAIWEDITQQAEGSHWTYPHYLATLCNQEIAYRDQVRIQRAILESKLPIGKTLDTFIFEKAASVNSAQINAFAENTQWVKQAHNLIIFGPSGVGKTHIAAAIGRRLIERGLKVLFTKTTSLVQKLQGAYNEQKLPDMLARLAKFELLILDDIGYVKKSDAETSVLFELIADRYESGSLLITSNQAFDQWDTIFSTNGMAHAAIDRIIHHATIINISEQSYRRASKIDVLFKA